jgi:hypothetical protein
MVATQLREAARCSGFSRVTGITYGEAEVAQISTVGIPERNILNELGTVVRKEVLMPLPAIPSIPQKIPHRLMRAMKGNGFGTSGARFPKRLRRL